jgi:hypothetical protein
MLDDYSKRIGLIEVLDINDVKKTSMTVNKDPVKQS